VQNWIWDLRDTDSVSKRKRDFQVGGKIKIIIIEKLSRNIFQFTCIKASSVHLLIISIFPISMDLVFQGEIKGEV